MRHAVASTLVPARIDMQLDWRIILGPALAATTALIAFTVDRHLVAVPNPAPLFVCIVALASSISGTASGLVTAAIAVAASALFFLDHRATPGGLYAADIDALRGSRRYQSRRPHRRRAARLAPGSGHADLAERLENVPADGRVRGRRPTSRRPSASVGCGKTDVCRLIGARRGRKG